MLPMKYGLRVSSTYLIMSVRWNLLPIFYEDGVFHTRMKIARVDGDNIVLKWAGEGEKAEARLRPMNSKGEGKGLRLDLRLSKTRITTSDHATLEPIQGGVVLKLGGKPDPGEEPKISPVFIKRAHFRPKMIDRSVDTRNTIRIYLMRKDVRKRIEGRYRALSHVGGSMFLFVEDPLQVRAPFLEIRHKKSELYEAIYAKLPIGLALIMGLEGRQFACYDFIEDIDGRHYLRLVDLDECKR